MFTLLIAEGNKDFLGDLVFIYLYLCYVTFADLDMFFFYNF